MITFGFLCDYFWISEIIESPKIIIPVISSVTDWEDPNNFISDAERDLFNQIIKLRRDELYHSIIVRKV